MDDMWMVVSEVHRLFQHSSRLGEQNRPEVCVHRQLNFSEICGTFSLTASEQFPSSPIFGAFRADTNSCSAREDEKPTQTERVTGSSLNFEYREILNGSPDRVIVLKD